MSIHSASQPHGLQPSPSPVVPFATALQLGRDGAAPELSWLVPLLTCADADAPALFDAADQLRRQTVGDTVHLRGLIEFSNICQRNCEYCGLRVDNLGRDRYRLEPDAIVQVARDAKELGFFSVVMQSGEDPWFTTERLADIVRRVKAATGLAITLSVGEREREAYQAWFDAGADRFLLRIETTDPELFARLHPDGDLKARQACLWTLKEIGYQLGSGVMTGLPGQTAESLARDVIWLHQLGVEMIGVGPFIPNPETPLAAAAGGTVAQTLRLVAVLRLVFPWAHIPATTAMGSLDPKGREKALQAGGNVVMPNVTPVENRDKYQLYPGKICTGDDARTCKGCLTGRLHSIGRTIAQDPGHVIRNPPPRSSIGKAVGGKGGRL